MKLCTMLDVQPEQVVDVECGKPARYVYKNDPEHHICQECFDAMADDPEIQGYYTPLPRDMTSAETHIELSTRYVFYRNGEEQYYRSVDKDADWCYCSDGTFVSDEISDKLDAAHRQFDRLLFEERTAKREAHIAAERERIVEGFKELRDDSVKSARAERDAARTSAKLWRWAFLLTFAASGFHLLLHRIP